MEVLEDKPCRFCKKKFTPKVFWQKFCCDDCHDDYWKGVYSEKAAINKRLEEVEKKVGIK